jgi:hypothetical protein
MSEPAETDALAAEYVLGTLDGPERDQARALLGTDQGFAAKVRVWERRLGELHLMVEPVEPDAELWHRIKSKAPAKAPPPDVVPPAPAVELPKAATPPAAEAAPTVAPAVPPPPTPSSAPASTPAPTPPPPPIPPVPAAPLASVSAASSALSAPAVSLPPAPGLAAPDSPPPPLVPSSATLDPAVPTPAALPAVVPTVREPTVERADEGLKTRRRLRRWRVFATLLLLILLAMGGLVAAWKFVPERVPPKLQAAELLRLVGIAVGPAAGPMRPPAPPESQFDE